MGLNPIPQPKPKPPNANSRCCKRSWTRCRRRKWSWSRRRRMRHRTLSARYLCLLLRSHTGQFRSQTSILFAADFQFRSQQRDSLHTIVVSSYLLLSHPLSSVLLLSPPRGVHRGRRGAAPSSSSLCERYSQISFGE